MSKKYIWIIVLLAVLVLLFYFNKTQNNGSITNDNKYGEDPFDRSISNIVYSKHAQCRMLCRNIDEYEVKEIIQKGKVRYDKIRSSKSSKRDPLYPLEGITSDGQKVMVVVASHHNKIYIITVIDLDKEWQCNCN
ncbi:MAG: DUF4258 domain-containing protein [Ferruginibacter sp.]